MGTFLNKKERVYDLKLTSYGKYLLSIGTFKPMYYAFFDDNVMYDATYAYTASNGNYMVTRQVEGQNNVNPRIKQKTVFLETQTLFRDAETTLGATEEEAISYDDLTPTQRTPAEDIFKFESAIGDAMLDGGPRVVPAWKVLMLNSRLSSSIYRTGPNVTPPIGYVTTAHSVDGDTTRDGPIEQHAEKGIILNSTIPQLNVDAHYVLKVADAEIDLNPGSVRDLTQVSKTFGDGKVIKLEMDDPVIYIEEVNTLLLTENFDIEVFEIESGSLSIGTTALYDPIFHRKYFEKKIPQIENGFMLMESQLDNPVQNLTTSSVEYYFDVLRDASIDQEIACQGIATFDKQTYYIDYDFECESDTSTTSNAVFYDIYGSVTEPEICQD